MGATDLISAGHTTQPVEQVRRLTEGRGADVAIEAVGSPETWQTVRSAPGLEDIWQLHYAVDGGADHNAPDSFTANLDEACQGKALFLTASEDGSFSVTNTRNDYSKAYPASGR